MGRPLTWEMPMNRCDAIQRRLAEDGVAAALSDAELQRHVEDCADCKAVLEDLRRLETALDQLPAHDATDALVASTLEAVRGASSEARPSRMAGFQRRHLAAVLAATVVIAATIGLSQNFMPFLTKESAFNGGVGGSVPSVTAEAEQSAEVPTSETEIASADHETDRPIAGWSSGSGTLDALSEAGERANEGAGEGIGAEKQMAQLEHAKPDVAQSRRYREEPRRAKEQAPVDELERALASRTRQQETDVRLRRESESLALLGTPTFEGEPDGQDREFGKSHRATEAANKREPNAVRGPTEPVGSAKSKTGDYSRENFQTGSDQFAFAAPPVNEPMSDAGASASNEEEPDRRAPSSDEKKRPQHRQDTDRAGDLAARQLGRDSGAKDEVAASAPLPGTSTITGGVATFDDNRARDLSALSDRDGGRRLATSFLDRYASLEGLTFKDPTGYWSNTYIPGDPAMRLLQTRLRAWDRGRFGQHARLEEAARSVVQPFDPPEHAALALYLQADTSGIQGPTRLRVQVGLKGAQRQGGHRPAMNVGLVVDLRSIADDETRRRVRALINALERVRQPGDRFSLTVAGPGGGMVVPPEQFRHGPLSVAMTRLFGEAPDPGSGDVDLVQAVSLAAQSVHEGADQSAILGASLVLLATGSSIADELSALERMAHDNAVRGVSLSVARLAAGADLDQVDRLVAAGQGHRRILNSADEADALIDRELHAASRAVARAVRLRIRLAPGVKLVDVLGSQRLEEPRAELVREAEQAIDRRLARNLGIQADRGRDEEGIQIVIPNFFANDSHVVLLDVVAEKPGPIADVTVRYKDVVYLRNGVARAQLTMAPGQSIVGPLERNVLKNLVAWELSRRTRLAGQYLEAGYWPEVGPLMVQLRDLIDELRLEVAGWSTDPDLVRDQAMLDDYLAVLSLPAARDDVQRGYLADSLRYAAFRKLQSAVK
jgi:hypothetical protein